MAKVFLIGGAARVGKTTAIEKFIKSRPMLGASTDAIRNVAKGMIKPEDNPKLFKTGRGAFNSRKNIDALANYHQTVLNYELGESEETWKSVLKFIEYNLKDGRDVAIEGIAILPKFINQLPFAHKALFIINLDEQTDVILQHALNNPYDWLHKYDEQTIRAFCKFNQTHNKYYYDEARKYGLPAVVIENGRFSDSIDQAVKILIS